MYYTHPPPPCGVHLYRSYTRPQTAAAAAAALSHMATHTWGGQVATIPHGWNERLKVLQVFFLLLASQKTLLQHHYHAGFIPPAFLSPSLL